MKKTGSNPAIMILLIVAVGIGICLNLPTGVTAQISPQPTPTFTPTPVPPTPTFTPVPPTPTFTPVPPTPTFTPAPNEPPIVTIDHKSVTIAEGQTASNNGSVSDPDGQIESLTASVGEIVRDTDGDTFSWNFSTTDGPDESQTVVIRGVDDTGAEKTTATFELTVSNVPPIVADIAAPTEPVKINDEPILVTVVFTDPGCTNDLLVKQKIEPKEESLV